MDDNEELPQSSRFEKSKNSSNTLFGSFAFIVLAIAILYSNEEKAIHLNKNIVEIEKYATLIQGKIEPTHTIIDPVFQIKSNDLVLKRVVSAYQWKEYRYTSSEHSSRPITEYEYKKVWSSFLYDSSEFKYSQNHTNHTLKYKTETFLSDATLNNYYIDKIIINKIDNFETFQNPNKDEFIYIGKDDKDPSLGDLKISYSVVPSTIYTILGAIQDNNIVPFQTTNYTNFIFLEKGNVDRETILEKEKKSRYSFIWLWRGIGFALLLLGLLMFFSRFKK